VLPALAPKLAADAWLYVESPFDETPSLPPDWTLHREGRTRDVRYALYRRQGRPPGQPRVTLDSDFIADGATTA
jgi:16S rRNA (guanine966-N2)-methyltransferase